MNLNKTNLVMPLFGNSIKKKFIKNLYSPKSSVYVHTPGLNLSKEKETVELIIGEKNDNVSKSLVQEIVFQIENKLQKDKINEIKKDEEKDEEKNEVKNEEKDEEKNEEKDEEKDENI